MADAWESLPDVKVDDWEKLPDVAAKPPAGKVPSPTGWKDAPPADENFWQRAKRELGDLPKLQRDKEREQTAMWGALASGAHGAAHAMEGRVNGALAALGTDAKGALKGQPASWDDLAKAYGDEKKRIEGAQEQNLKDFPNAPLVGSLMAGGVGSAPTALGRIALGTGQGAVYGYGSSDGDMKATRNGALLGAGGAALGEVAQGAGRWLAGKAGKISDATHAAELAAETEARQGAVKSAIGSEGGLTSAAMKAWDRLEDAMFNPAANEETKAWARQFISSDEGKALYNQVLKNYADEAPNMMGRLTAAKGARSAAEAANRPELIQQAAAAAAEAKLNDPGGVTGRLAELARRNVPPAIGAAVGGAPGAAAGALVAGAMGKPGTIVSNMMKSPSTYQPLVKGAAVGIGAGNAMSHAVPPLAEWARFLGPEKDEDHE